MDHGLNAAALALICGCLILWVLISARIERLNLTAPIAFMVLGLVATNGPLAPVHVSLHSSTIRTVAEVTLALVLFVDASRVNARAMRADVGLPALGLPMTIGEAPLPRPSSSRGAGCGWRH